MIKKLSFRSVVSLVIGSQIGSGVFLLPASLAIVGPIGLFGWLVSGTGAIFLALVFAKLSMLVSNKGGGPHVYVEKAFGKQAAFFVAWTYWLVSWLSSLAVIIAAVSYFSLLVPLLLMGGIFYFLVIMPQRKQKAQLEELISSLKSGDEVVTNGGVIGKIREVRDASFIIQSAEKSFIEIGKSAVVGRRP